jgi:SAM-dependent methyltransferase
MAIGDVLRRLAPDFADRRILELSSRGPFYAYLARSVARGSGTLVACEYFDDVTPGSYRGDVQCQDVQRLSYPDASFGLCTSTEVFEHVPDDARGLREIYRVLEPGGLCVFTVPLSTAAVTVERARFEGDEVIHLEEPVYHDDFIRGSGRVLVYRDYGLDVTERLRSAGFAEASVESVSDPAGFGCMASVVVARKH